MKIAYTPMNVSQKWTLPTPSFKNRPNIFGNQKYMPANIPKIAATPMIRWKCATTKYPSCKYKSSDGCAKNSPERPPLTNSDTNPRANSIAQLNVILPPQSVPSQLKVLIAEGTPIVIVRIENANAEYGLIPLINMWWPHTQKPRKPIPQTAPTMARYPNTGLRENVESRCDVTPILGRIAMYTSGCPKNQNKCCHSSGEPPLCQVTT